MPPTLGINISGPRSPTSLGLFACIVPPPASPVAGAFGVIGDPLVPDKLNAPSMASTIG